VNLSGKVMYWKHISCLGYIFGVIAAAATQDWINQGAVELPAIVGTAAAASDNEVTLEKQGGTYALLVQINRAITLKFILDSGASDVLIPADVFLTLLRTGTVSEGDFLGSQTYSLADGSKLKGRRFIIRELRVGNQVATDVVASVGPVSGDLLLGLSFLSKFGAVTLDNERHVLVLSARGSIQPRVERQRDEEVTVKVPASPDYLSALSAGEAAYNQRNYSTALSMLQPAAQAGDSLAQYYLGVMILKVKVSPKTLNLLSSGCPKQPRPVTRMPKLIWLPSIGGATSFQRTTQRHCDGTRSQRSRITRIHSTELPLCTTRARASGRICVKLMGGDRVSRR
jgi:predicted aspartyl protease